MLASGPSAAAADVDIDLSQTTLTKIVKSGPGGEKLGEAVAALGDVNGDKCGDVGVGLEGASYVVFGCTKEPLIDLDTLGDGGWRTNQGGRIEAAGDVNGDGLADALVHYGSSSTVVFGARSKAGKDGRWLFGAFNVHGIGDLNGDGFDDLAAAFPSSVDHKVYVVFGRRKHATMSAKQIRSSRMPITRIDYQSPPESFSGAGDVNGDGLDDLLLGTTMYARGPGAFVVLGRKRPGPVNLDRMRGAGWRIVEQQPSNSSYTSYLTLGSADVNGDGFDDVLLNDPYDDRGIVVFGKPDSREVSLDAFKGKGFFLKSFGYDNLSRFGDVNGDGFGDLVNGRASSIDIILGSRKPGQRPKPAAVLRLGEAVTGGLRLSMLVGGRFTKDKVPDLVFGVQDDWGDGPKPGAVYIVSGRSIKQALRPAGKADVVRTGH